VVFVEVPQEQVATSSQETAEKMACFNHHGYCAGIPDPRQLLPGLLSFDA
jgi:hypothetical protein